ncbi:hypothetical protein LJC05_01415 [Bacteroides sp. OttesenSCG-928-J23]|nr:hypothetical protein [Bacteroides sp. OttesenSCG-928-J23]MDL2305014.1 hypothetical protein [Bacteroides sp. OttesenSCG-928-D19]
MNKYKLVYLFSVISLMGFFYFCSNSNNEDYNLSELLRKGYYSINNESFEEIALELNDSIMTMDFEEIFILPSIDEVDSIIDWYPIVTREVIRGEMTWCCIEMHPNSVLKIEGKLSELSEIKNIASCVFNFDNSPTWEREEELAGIGKVKIPLKAAFLEVNMSPNGFSVEDWKFFYKCLHELIIMCDARRNEMSLELLGKEYSSLLFEEKAMFISVFSYPIIINFAKMFPHPHSQINPFTRSAVTGRMISINN